ncbi:MAG: 1-deoxy-D-xylulose-5-phosphate synthase [Oscillospiraceae bacterium]|nr:1-deoxy-D-xylulose-5-phosphate synthase [Oscillospiraceae bacterium]
MNILEKIHGHSDLTALDADQRQELCAQIRQFLIDNISKTGGHLASNLGVVELTVALETVFDTENDRLVFDVGHQSYVHKLLTGRQADFAQLRQFGGIAGFPKPCESNTDAFVAGHASNSVSIALGMARARTLLGEDYDVVAVIGDGAATGGMAYEGLNDAADSGEPMVVILNDNEMSIDRNVGGFARHLSRLRTKEKYLGMKAHYRSFLTDLPGGRFIYRVTSRMKDWLKRVLLPTTIFENMGFTYLGPVDGHDLESLTSLLQYAKELRKPVLVHVLTQKGKGYKYAESSPAQFHGIGCFDPESGKAAGKGSSTFSDTFGDQLTALARENPRICAITAAMPGGTGLLKFKDEFPKRLFDVGIAEEHAVSMAGGLAKQGMIPVVAVYSTFLQRAYDQLLQDIAMLKLHVVFAVDRAGLVGEDGETHHGVFDVGYLRQIPGMTVLAPASCEELRQMLRWAVNVCDGPAAIRYPRGGDGPYHSARWSSSNCVLTHREGNSCAIITYGTLINQALEAADILAQQGIEAKVIRLTALNPLPEDALREALADISNVFVVEETCAGSGISAAISHQICKCTALDLGGEYVTHGSIRQLYQKHGLDASSIAQKIQEVLVCEN